MLASAKRVVVKIGSSLLVDGDSGQPARVWLATLANDIADMRRAGQQLVVVSSGAIALGRSALDLGRTVRLEHKQAAAAVGQARLIEAYQEAFAPHSIIVAQALLTTDDTERRRRWLNARATLETVMDLGAVPVINENDTVATAEIRYGDNDRLAARVAQMIGADVLVLLSDVDGLYERDPRLNPNAEFVPEVREITPTIEAMAGGAGRLGSGGMRTKLEAARIATGAGCAVAITRGATLHPLAVLKAGGQATWFYPQSTPPAAYKAWIAGALTPSGVLVVDDGAAAALRTGKSLLASGVLEVRGAFEKGDAVRIQGADGTEIARGLIRYDATDAHLIRGLRSAEIAPALGYDAGAALVHADDLVLT